MNLAVVYLVVALLEIASEVTGNQLLKFISKPLLMPVLMLFYYSNISKPISSFHKKFLIAFFFSWLGDVFLMIPFNQEIFFLLGLGSFLVAHILYALCFANVTFKNKEALLPKKFWVLVPLLAYFILLLYSFFGNVPGEMKGPVAVYSLAIATMVVFAVNRYGRVNEKSFALAFAGALLFMFSDSIIALNKFLFDGNLFLSGFWIMILYISGQYLIAKGALEQGAE
jgi:uncharacterized membrane protein YhhN